MAKTYAAFYLPVVRNISKIFTKLINWISFVDKKHIVRILSYERREI